MHVLAMAIFPYWGHPDFSDALADYEWIGDFFAKLDGKLHGPVHIMIGGHWDVDTQTASWLGTGMGDRSQLIARAILSATFRARRPANTVRAQLVAHDA